MEENKFWYGIWKLVAICFCVLSVSAAGCTIQQNSRSNDALEKLVSGGADPLAAKEAVRAMQFR